MVRIEAALNNNAVATPQPDLDRTPWLWQLRRSLWDRRHCDLSNAGASESRNRFFHS